MVTNHLVPASAYAHETRPVRHGWEAVAYWQRVTLALRALEPTAKQRTSRKK